MEELNLDYGAFLGLINHVNKVEEILVDDKDQEAELNLVSNNEPLPRSA